MARRVFCRPRVLNPTTFRPTRQEVDQKAKEVLKRIKQLLNAINIVLKQRFKQCLKSIKNRLTIIKSYQTLLNAI